MVIENSTISGNTAGGNGGGIYNYDSNLSLYQVTGSDNYATGNGGFNMNRVNGIYVGTPNQATISMNRSTVAYNESLGGGGGQYSDYYAEMTIDNSIISGNVAGTAGNDLYTYRTDADLNFDLNYSLLSDDITDGLGNSAVTAGANNIFNMSGDLGLLADNGGPTLTHLPNGGSPAIDAA